MTAVVPTIVEHQALDAAVQLVTARVTNLEDAVSALENDTGTTPLSDPPSDNGADVQHFGTDTRIKSAITASDLNAMIQWKHNEGGGQIRLVSEAGYTWDTPIIVRPSVELVGGTPAGIYTKRTTRARTTHNGPVFIGTDDTAGPITEGAWEAWGTLAIRNFQVETRDGQEALLQIEGGNVSEYEYLTSVGGKVANTVLVDQGRRYDGQYSTVRRVSSTRTALGLNVQRGVPDNEYHDSLWYGSVKLNSSNTPANTSDVGVYLADDVHNQKINNCHAQFNYVGYDIGGRENRINDGSWENDHQDHKKAANGAAAYATVLKVRDSARDLVVTWLSLANTKAAKSIIDVNKGRGVTAAFSFTSPNRSDVQAKLAAAGLTEYVTWTHGIN